MLSKDQLSAIADEAVASSASVRKLAKTNDADLNKLAKAEEKVAELRGAETPNKDRIAKATEALKVAKTAHKASTKALNTEVRVVAAEAKKVAKQNAKAEAKDARDKEREARKEARAAEAAARKEANTLEKSNGITHPKEGGITGRLWAMMDSMYAAQGSTPTIADVMAKGESITSKANTLKSQYASWKKFNGYAPAVRPVKVASAKPKAAGKKKAAAKKASPVKKKRPYSKKKASSKKRATKK